MTVLKVILRTFLRFIRDIDGVFMTITTPFFKPAYSITGSCKKRGICCQNIAIGLSPKLSSIKKWVINYYEFVYNFEFITHLKNEHVLLFRCHYLKNKTCQIHWKRPYICRNYPVKRFYNLPTMLPGCGYKVLNTIKYRGAKDVD